MAAIARTTSALKAPGRAEVPIRIVGCTARMVSSSEMWLGSATSQVSTSARERAYGSWKSRMPCEPSTISPRLLNA